MREFLRAVFILALATSTRAAEFPAPYNSEPGNPQPISAEEAAKSFKMPPGFKVQVFASEPDVQNPIAMAWDARGRLWIAENYTYAENRKKFELTLRDRIVILADKDGDGRFDERKVFTDDLQMLTSIELGFGGVYALCPPQLLWIPMKDDQPSGAPVVLLDGFKVPAENYHNFANGLRWGPDGWLYGRCGASAPGEVGAPGTPDAERVPLRGGIWRYHPQRKTFEALCHGTTNPWGHDWNEHGEGFFTNTVNGHLWHLIPGAHYTRPHTIDPNPYVYELIDQHADHYHFDTGKGWTNSRDGKANEFGGGHAHIGCMIYLGDNWPAEYRGKLFTLNMHGRRVNVDRLDRQGSGYVGKHEADMIFVGDPWFRGIELSYGPDGGVFILDWSDTGECHDSTGVHRTSGRIYKVTYEGNAPRSGLTNPQGSARAPRAPSGAPPEGSKTAEQPSKESGVAPDPAREAPALPNPKIPFDLAKMSNEELVKLHEHPNEWWTRMARRILAERQQSGTDKNVALSLLQNAFTTSRNPAHQVRLLFSASLTGADPNWIIGSLKNADEHVRAVAVRLLTDNAPLDMVSGQTRTAIGDASTRAKSEISERAVSDDSGLVRLAIASAANRYSTVDRMSLLSNLLNRGEDAADHNIPLLLWYAIAPIAQDRASTLVDLVPGWRIPLARKLLARRLAADFEKQAVPLGKLLAAQDTKLPSVQKDIVSGLTEGFTGWRKAAKPASWDEFAAKVTASRDADILNKVRDLSVLFGDGRALDEVKRIALDGKADLGARQAALKSLIDAQPPALRELCEKLLSVRFLNTTAARGLAKFEDATIGERLAKSYSQFHPSERQPLLETLVARPIFARALLAEMSAGKIPRADLSAFHARQIRSFNDPDLTHQLAQVWGDLRDSNEEKRTLIAQLKAQLTPEHLGKANPRAGRALFNQICASCHTLYGHGGKIAPDLTGSQRDNLDYLLENIVDPGAVLSADFRMTVATLKDGRVVNGMVTAKTDRTLTLQTMTEPQTVERAEIAKMEQLPVSLMPDGLLQALTETQVRDLFAYLTTRAQVPLP